MKKTFYLLGLAVLCLGFSCRTSYEIASIEGERIAVDSTWMQPVDSSVTAIIDKYKHRLDEEMNVVIGTAAETMVSTLPESPLTNLTADVLLQYADKQNPENFDFALMNSQGIRTALNKGNITLGNVYEVYPFENKVVFLELNGKYVEDLFKFYARNGGEGVSSTIRLSIRDKEIEGLTIGGKPLDKDKTYKIVTIDYLAEGNDGMKALSFSSKKTDTGLMLRDLMIDYIKNQTSGNKPVQAVNDGRVQILN